MFREEMATPVQTRAFHPGSFGLCRSVLQNVILRCPLEEALKRLGWRRAILALLWYLDAKPDVPRTLLYDLVQST